MKLLLISPNWPVGSLWGQIYFRFPYLSLTSLAALTPREWDVRIVDENVSSLDLSDKPDLVGISLMTPLAKRGYEIADAFRAKGVPVILGGIHATMLPEEAKEHAEAVVSGEAEGLWPQVLADHQAGRLKPFYRTQDYCDLSGLPFPKRELLPPRAYFFTNTIQTTRGCPFDCDFCSVTSFFGRTYRTQPVTDIVREIEHLKAKIIFFVDDNRLYGGRSIIKRLFPFKRSAMFIGVQNIGFRLAWKKAVKSY